MLPGEGPDRRCRAVHAHGRTIERRISSCRRRQCRSFCLVPLSQLAYLVASFLSRCGSRQPAFLRASRWCSRQPARRPGWSSTPPLWCTGERNQCTAGRSACAGNLLPVAARRRSPLPIMPSSLDVLLARVVEGVGGCVVLSVQLQNGAEHHGSACPGSSGAAVFALSLPLGSGGSGQPGRLVVKQPPSAPGAPGRLWQQLITAAPSVQLSIDMRQAEVLPAAAPAPTSAAAAHPPAGPAPTCTYKQQQRCCTDLEDVADRSLPAYQALAFPAPTCLAPQPSAPSTPAAPSTQQAPSLSNVLAGLAAACAVQAVAIAVLLGRRASSSSAVVASATGGHQTAEEAAAPVRRRPALIDACTSPLALLASPFARRRRQSGDELNSIPEDQPVQRQQQAQCSPAAQRGGGYGQQGGSPQLQTGGSLGSLAPAPAGWTRWVLKGALNKLKERSWAAPTVVGATVGAVCRADPCGPAIKLVYPACRRCSLAHMMCNAFRAPTHSLLLIQGRMGPPAAAVGRRWRMERQASSAEPCAFWLWRPCSLQPAGHSLPAEQPAVQRGVRTQAAAVVRTKQLRRQMHPRISCPCWQHKAAGVTIWRWRLRAGKRDLHAPVTTQF